MTSVNDVPYKILIQASKIKKKVELLHSDWKKWDIIPNRDVAAEFEMRVRLRKLEAGCKVHYLTPPLSLPSIGHSTNVT